MNDCSASQSLWKTDVDPIMSHPVRVTLMAIMVVCKPGLVSPVLSPNPWSCSYGAVIHGGSLLRNSVLACREGSD